MDAAPELRPVGARRRLPPGNARMTASPFSRLAVAHAFHVAGDTLVAIALAGSLFFDISPTAARGRVALSLLLTMAPFAVVAPFVGPVLDRSRGGRRAMVVLAAVGRAVTCVAMAVHLDALVLFPLAFATLVLSKAHSVAKSSLVPTAVSGPSGLVEANAKLALGSVVVGFLTGGPGVALLRLAGGEWVLRVAAVVFVTAAGAGLRIPPPAPARRVEQDAALAEVKAATVVVGGAAMGLLRAVVGFITFLIAFDLRRSGAPSWWFGVALAASMGGSFAGTVVATRVRARIGEERMLTLCLATVAVGGGLAARVGGRLGAVALAAVVGLAASIGKLAFDALVQREAPDAARGRAFARFESWFQIAWVAGALAPVAVPLGLRPGVLGLTVVGALAAVASAVAHRRPPTGRNGRPRRRAGVEPPAAVDPAVPPG